MTASGQEQRSADALIRALRTQNTKIRADEGIRAPIEAAPDFSRTLIDELLAEQRRLTPVERFAHCEKQALIPAQAKYYRDLIPLSKPQPGQQYAFEVDLDKCSGCKACVSACHSLNGLDEDESWRDTGLLLSNDWREPFQQ